MALQPNNNRIARFGVFELDLGTGELRKGGVKLRLQGRRTRPSPSARFRL